VRNGAARAAVWFVAVAIPLLVALSRMYRGMHHPTDVAAGALWGVGSILVAVMAARAAARAEERAAA
jgi:undecaprenyl-diphosphatase